MRKLTLCLFFLFGCTDVDATRSVLESQGFTNVRTTGHDFWACADSDTTCTGFVATSPAGIQVTGVVGCGMGCGKACTVRFH